MNRDLKISQLGKGTIFLMRSSISFKSRRDLLVQHDFGPLYPPCGLICRPKIIKADKSVFPNSNHDKYDHIYLVQKKGAG